MNSALITHSKNLYEEYKRKSKGYQSAQRIRRKILTFANLIEIDLENWSKFEIFAAWQYLERTAKQELSHTGLRNHLMDIKNVFQDEGLDLFTKFDREIKLFTNGYINSRIDNSDKPWTKKSANRPPYKVWKQISKAMSDQLVANKFTNALKRLRLMQSRILLIWSRSSGARLEELVRLKISDIQVMTMKSNNLMYLDLNIRRSKSNRQGKKEKHHKCFKNVVDEILCPVKCFEEYLESYPSISQPGDYVFPSGLEHTDRYVNGSAVVYNWSKTCKMLNLPPELHPKGHSGHDCLICLAYAKNKNPTEILDITQWNSMAVMPNYIQGPKPEGLGIEIATTSVDDLDTSIIDVLEFNSRIHS